MNQEVPRVGVRIAGTGSAVPDRVITNADLAAIMDTSDEWIVQRTGIRERRIIDVEAGESFLTLGSTALDRALKDARLPPSELDLVIFATMCQDMTCPPGACRLATSVGAIGAGAFDLVAACSGWVFGMNNAYAFIRSGMARTVAVVGCDTLTMHCEYNTHGRAVAVLFGDAAGAAILRATDDARCGLLAQSMHTDARNWECLYVPRAERDFPLEHRGQGAVVGTIQMSGKSVFKFAVGTFPALIAETLEKAGLRPEDVDHFVCHQSNARILEAARERFGIPREKLYVNIDRYGNSSAGSVPLCFDELRKAGRVREGQRVMFVAFGGGLTWGSSLWQL